MYTDSILTTNYKNLMPNIMLLAKITPNFTTDNQEHYNFLYNYISTGDIYIYH